MNRIPTPKQLAKQMIAKKNKRLNPLDVVVYTGNVEVDSLAELKQINKAFANSIQGQRDAIEKNNDTEFWCAVVFKTREQKEAFLKQYDLFQYGDKYIYAEDFCNQLKLKLIPENFEPKKPRVDKVWTLFC